MNNWTRAALAAFALVAGIVSASAQTSYPTRPITLVVASAPGGTADIYGRLIAEKMSVILGQKIVPDNVAGSGGIIGTARVARAESDGYTLLIHQTGIAIAPALTPNLQFDVAKALTVVGLINEGHGLLIGRKDIPANTLSELMDWMRGPGKPARLAHPGVGSLGHFSTELFGKYVGVEINAVPYRGIAPALNDLFGGHVDLLWGPAGMFAPLVKADKVKAFVFGGPKRSPLVPDLPAISEFPASEILSAPIWHALFAPAGTPKPIIDKLNSALRQALADPQVVKIFQDGAIDVFPADMQSPEAGNAYVKRELARWPDVVKTLGMKPTN